tara:strand:- start:181 stop:675 length:495 start_codon:yes stop_codon:yes gene_type:complete
MNPIYEGTVTLESFKNRVIQFDNYDQDLTYTGYDISELYHKTPYIPGLYAVTENLCLVSAYKTGNNCKFNFDRQFHFYSKGLLKIDEEYINIVDTEEQLDKVNSRKPLHVQLSRKFDKESTLAKILMCTKTTEQLDSKNTPLYLVTAKLVGIGLEQEYPSDEDD